MNETVDVDGLRDSARTAEGVEPGGWSRFETADSASSFLAGWLAILAERLAQARAAALFVAADDRRLGMATGWRLAEADEAAFSEAAEAAARRPEPTLANAQTGVLLGWPIVLDGVTQAVLVVAFAEHPRAGLRQAMREIRWAIGWIEAQLWKGRSAIGRRQAGAALVTLDCLAAADEHPRFDAAALALVDALAARRDLDRAFLGMVRRGRMRLEAMSSAAAFKRRADLVRAVEAAMDEALGQGAPVGAPVVPGGAPVDLAHRALVDRLGAGAVLTVPLLVRGGVVGALTLVRDRRDDAATAFAPAFLEEARLAAAAVAPVLHLKHAERRWLSGRLVDYGGRGATAVLGRRPAFTLGAIVALAAVVVLATVHTAFRVSADAVIQGFEQRAAIAPMDGFLAGVEARAGDEVEAGDVLARLDDRELALEHERALARVRQAEQARRDALAGGDRAAAAAAAAEVREANAALALVRARLARAPVLAPTDGLVVSGDLSQRLGAPVSRGEILFEVARLDRFRLLIDVSEIDIRWVEAGQTGSFVPGGLTGTPIPFRLTGVSSVSTPEGGENRFRVEADVTAPVEGLRPGMEGVAKIEVGRARFVWTALRGTLERVRLFLWRWAP